MRKILDEKTEILKAINDNVHELPFVISIPHSGLYLTSEMSSKLKEDVILANMDWYLPKLYVFLEKLKFTVLVNNISRYVIDSNRDINSISSEKYTKSLINKLCRNPHKNKKISSEKTQIFIKPRKISF